MIGVLPSVKSLIRYWSVSLDILNLIFRFIVFIVHNWSINIALFTGNGKPFWCPHLVFFGVQIKNGWVNLSKTRIPQTIQCHFDTLKISRCGVKYYGYHGSSHWLQLVVQIMRRDGKLDVTITLSLMNRLHQSKYTKKTMFFLAAVKRSRPYLWVDNVDFLNLTKMHSSRMRTAGSSSRFGGGSPPGTPTPGPGTPPPR